MRLPCLNSMGLIFRYISSGIWNTFFAWLIFAGIWFLGEAIAPLWVLAVLAHLLATTQAFFVQRRWVFKPQEGSVLSQYFRFQWVYIGLLGIGLLMLQALQAQGVHPLIAQMGVMVVQAFSGFSLGRSFTFSQEKFSFWQLLLRILNRIRKSAVAWLIFILSLLVFHQTFSKPFYSSLTHVGHDFSLAATALLEGKFWLQSNGIIAGIFNPPWFTPAWCGGAAFFADPQAGFYSPLQWLVLIFNPFLATQIATLMFAALAFWGSYAVARIVFRWNLYAAAIFAVLGMFNAFMPMRSAVGEIGYQPIYLWTLLLLALCWPSTGRPGLWSRLAGPSLAVMCVLTAWLHFGFAGMMVPMFIGVVLLCLVLTITDRAQINLVLMRAALGGVLAIIFNGSKLYEAASLMRNFPRDFYAMPGFPSLYDALVASIMALILPSEWTTYFGIRRLTDVQFSVMPHEWALEFGWGALAMALLGGLVLFLPQYRQTSSSRPRRAADSQNIQVLRKYALWLGVVLLAVLPLLLLWNQGPVRDVLKKIPILNSAAWPMRWIVVYLPLFQWLLALPVQRLFSKTSEKHHVLALIIASVFVWLGPITMPKDYYLDANHQNYNPENILGAYQETQRTGQQIAIENIIANPEHRGYGNRNDAMLFGDSQGFCYNPIYGYRLEAFPQINRLQSGPALAKDNNGQSLLYNPACLVHPEANACKPGDGFFLDRPEQKIAAENFLARQPFEWNRPWWGKILSLVSQIMFWIVATWLILLGWQTLLRKSVFVKLF